MHLPKAMPSLRGSQFEVLFWAVWRVSPPSQEPQGVGQWSRHTPWMVILPSPIALPPGSSPAGPLSPLSPSMHWNYVYEGECFPGIGTLECEALLSTQRKAACNRRGDTPSRTGGVMGAE